MCLKRVQTQNCKVSQLGEGVIRLKDLFVQCGKVFAQPCVQFTFLKSESGEQSKSLKNNKRRGRGGASDGKQSNYPLHKRALCPTVGGKCDFQYSDKLRLFDKHINKEQHFFS